MARTVFEGFRTTTRSVAMLKEARKLFKLRGGGTPPKITQGGYNAGGVSESAGTHDRDAMDFATRLFSLTRSKLWEWCLWEVGFAAWRRQYIAGLWPAHTHAVPKEGDLSAGAANQVTQFHQGDNALQGDLDYPRILSSGFARRTWAGYKDVRDKLSGIIDLSGVIGAFKAGTQPPLSQNEGDNDIHQIQRALNHYLDSKLTVDGVPGSATKGVYATYQSRLYGIPKWSADANGIPGRDSLEKLGFNMVA